MGNPPLVAFAAANSFVHARATMATIVRARIPQALDVFFKQRLLFLRRAGNVARRCHPPARLRRGVTHAAAAAIGTGLFAPLSTAGAQQITDSTARRTQRVLDSLSTALRSMQGRMDSLERAVSTAPAPAPAVQPRAAGSYMNIGFDGLADGGWTTDKDGTRLLRGDHDPLVRGFTIPNGELTLDAAVDPYFKGFTNIVYKLDRNGETAVELEEMYVLSTSLPSNLQAKAGQFFAEFGRHNPQHPHQWAFIDQPLVITQMFGPEGLRSQGLRMSWLVPTPFYLEAMVAVLNSAGGTAFSFRSDESPLIHGGVLFPRDVRNLGDMLYVPRVATSFDIGETQTIVAGVSGALGPNNSNSNSRTQIYGADVYWKWKSVRAAQGFPFVSFQAEAMTRRYEAGERESIELPLRVLPDENLDDRGGYAQVLWGIRPRIVAGLRGDLISGDSAAFASDFRAQRRRIAPNFTWYPSEFSKLRIQYNYDHRKGFGSDHSVWFQFEFIMGAHAAHKF